MSRTFRNRHYHWDGPRGGSKIALEYTEHDYSREHGHIYREPTPREAYKTFRWRHLDHHSNEVSASWSYRHARIVQNRAINKHELHKWIARPDEYEPLFEENPRCCGWDWC